MNRWIAFIFLVFSICLCPAQTLDIRPQFGHDPLFGDVSDDGRYAVTGSRNTIILWELQSGNAVIERPFRCMDVRFVKGFPFYCVAADLLHGDGGSDSIENVRTVINLLTGEELFQMEEDEVGSRDRSAFQFSIPFDARGRFAVVDNRGETQSRWGGKLPGGMSSIEISPDGEFLLVAGKHPLVWELDEMRIHREIPLYEQFMSSGDVLDVGLDVLPWLKNAFRFKQKRAVLAGWRQFYKAHFTSDKRIVAGTPGGDIYFFSLEGDLLQVCSTEAGVNQVYDCALVGDTLLAATSRWTYVGSPAADSLIRCRTPEADRKRSFAIVYEVLPIPEKDTFYCTTDSWLLYRGCISHPEDGLEIVPPGGGRVSSLSLARIDDRRLFITQTAGFYSFFDMETKAAETYKWEGVTADLHACCVLDDGRILIGGDMGQVAVIPEGETRVRYVISLGFGQVRGFAEDVRRKRVYVSSNDGALRILDGKSLTLIATCYYLGDGNSIIFTPDGYYAADKSVANLIMYGRGAELFSFDRFDLVNNRPDIVAGRLGKPEEEVQLLERTYRKRLRRMGFDPGQVQETENLPTIAVTRFPASTQTQVDKISVSVQCDDKAYPVRRIMAWLNGTPILGRDGLSVDGNKVVWDIPVQLTSGENRIEVSCINAAGVESVRTTKTITYLNPEAKRNLYIVSLGISRYRQSGYALRYAAKDAADMSNLFQMYGGGLYDNVYTLRLTDREVNTETLPLIRQFLSGAGRDDVVLAFYAGHGLVGRDYDYFLSTYETDFSSPEQSAMSYEDFETVFDGILPLDKLIIIDACHAGEIDKEDVRYAVNVATTKGKVLFRGSSLGEESMESQLLRAQFNDIRRGTGATVFAGSSGMEVAVEGDQWQNGLFTWALRNGLQNMEADADRDGYVTVSELMRYGQTEVYRLSEGRQSPSARSVNPYCDFVIRGPEREGKRD